MREMLFAQSNSAPANIMFRLILDVEASGGCKLRVWRWFNNFLRGGALTKSEIIVMTEIVYIRLKDQIIKDTFVDFFFETPGYGRILKKNSGNQILFFYPPPLCTPKK